jgi:dephospho-CoA kinase
MVIIGLTGGIGSGKSEVAKIFQSLRIEVIDLDDIAKNVTKKDSDGYKKIVALFGNNLLSKNLELKRKEIQKIIFNSESLKEQFEKIIHPIIYRSCIGKIKKIKNGTYVVIVVPLLFEMKKFQKIISESLLIDCEEKVQINRVVSRDKIPTELIKIIIKNQMSREEKQKKADKIILNNTNNISKLKANVIKYHNYIISKIYQENK